MAENKKIRKTYFSELKKRVFYSQNREDLLLAAFFPDVKRGFYIDVGAYDPDIDSVTKLFYLRGWSGINIEPQADRIRSFHKKRPRDTNLNIGLSDKQTELKLRSYKNQGLSTFSDEMKHSYEETPESGTTEYEEITVSVKTLKSVLDDMQFNGVIHFIKIDVEGYEYEVLSGNDWDKYRPQVICIESNHIVKDWRPLLVEHGYEPIFNDGLNDYYADSRSGVGQVFDYVNKVLLEKSGGIKAEDYKTIESLRLSYEAANTELQILRESNDAYKDKVTRLQEELTEKRVENDNLKNEAKQKQAQIERQQVTLDKQAEEINSIKRTLVRLRELTKARIRRTGKQNGK